MYRIITYIIIVLSAFILACGGGGKSKSVPQLTDAESVQVDADSLTADDFIFVDDNNADNVTSDFQVPGNGDNGTTITWGSDSDNVMINGTEASIVWFGFDLPSQTDVKLTATVQKGDESTTKEIEITVIPSSTPKSILVLDDITFKMVLVPGGHTFPSGDTDNTTKTVDDDYWIGETEVTYELWKKVYDWAIHDDRGPKKYSFANAGNQGGGAGTNSKHPVDNISWRDAMIWSNAFTEWYNSKNSTTFSCVYYSNSDYSTPIRTSTDSTTITKTTPGTQDAPYIKAAVNGNTDMANCTANGFRLLRLAEWEMAARWRGKDITNTVQTEIGGVDFSNPADGIYWTKGNSASGATDNYENLIVNDVVAVYNEDSTEEVKSRTSNALGLFDMSGNVYEWCFDWFPHIVGDTYRTLQGGNWNAYDPGNLYHLQIGYCPYGYPPYNRGGFRFSKLK